MTIDGERGDLGASDSPFGVTASTLREVSAALGGVLRYLAEYRLDSDFEEGFDPVAVVVGSVLNASAEPYAGIALTPGRKGHTPDFIKEVGGGSRQHSRKTRTGPTVSSRAAFSAVNRRLAGW